MAIQHYFDRAKVDYDEVYEAGKKAQYDEFWDSFQNYGARTAYYYTFATWADNLFYPKYDIKLVGWSPSTFQEAKIVNFKQRLIDCGVTFDSSKNTSVAGLFSGCIYNTALPTIDTTSSADIYKVFYDNRALTEIEKLVLKNDGSQTFSTQPFYNCSELVNLTIEGVIGQNGFDIHWSTKLSKASIYSIINALSTTTSGLTVTFSKTAVESAFGSTTSTEWLALVATKSNWTISLV